MRIITKGRAVLTMLCSILFAAGIVNAQDAPYQVPVGTQGSCNASGTSTATFNEGLTVEVPYEGTATFETISNDNTADGRASTQLVPVEFQGAGYSPEVGTVIWTADIDRTLADGLVSTITANQEDEALPATGTLQFHAQITLTDPDGGEDAVYISENPVVMVDRSLTVWPHENARYLQQGTVIFANIQDPTRKIVVTHMTGIIIAQPTPIGPCIDPCCKTDALSLNTGYNYATGAVYNTGSLDNYWTIIADENLARVVPRKANVIAKASVWPNPQPNTQWIGANPTAVDNFLGRVTYQKCFCLCQKSTLTFNMSILVDDQADIYVDGLFVGSTPDLGFGTPTNLAFTLTLAAGTHCIEVVVDNNYQSHAGLNIQGTVQGSGLLKYNCCGVQPPPPPCGTNKLVLGTNSTWSLISGPPVFGPYPRCATVITQPNGAWGAPVTGSSWIGTNIRGTSGPWHKGATDLYVYRKCFCVDQAGTYTITITTMADDMVDVFLNTTALFSYAGYTTPTTRTFIVALTKGCHCLEFRVRDLGWVVTGLDALVTIQGALLLQDDCCACSKCTNPPSNPPDGLNPPDLGMIQGEGSEGIAMDHSAAASIEARPMLLNIPDEATGATMVHYVMDQDAEAQVALFNTSGEKVRVLDEGTRTLGEHSVPLVTDNLPAGSYRLQLVYGEHTLTVPVNVE